MELRESPWTIPNALTTMRILACPVLGYFVVKGQFDYATGLLVACGFSDWVSTPTKQEIDMVFPADGI